MPLSGKGSTTTRKILARAASYLRHALTSCGTRHILARMTTSSVRPLLREPLAEEIRALMGRRRVTGANIAAALGKSQSYVSRRLTGETAFDTDDLEIISGLLKVDPETLLASARGTMLRLRPGAERVSTLARTGSRPSDTRPTGRPGVGGRPVSIPRPTRVPRVANA